MEDGLKQLGFGVPFIEATSVSSTSTSLTGVDTIPSASRSSWLSSDCAELRFKPTEGCRFGVPLLLFRLLLLGIIAFGIIRLSSTIHSLNLLKINVTIMSAKAQKKVFLTKSLTLLWSVSSST